MLLVRIPHILRDPNKDGSDSNKIPSLLILRNMINNLHKMLDQFLARLVPLPADHLHMIITGCEEERVTAQELYLALSGRSNTHS